MVNWNYRIVKIVEEGIDNTSGDQVQHHLREVYYEEDGSMHLVMEESTPFETMREVRQDFRLKAKAFDKPVLLLQGTTLFETDEYYEE